MFPLETCLRGWDPGLAPRLSWSLIVVLATEMPWPTRVRPCPPPSTSQGHSRLKDAAWISLAHFWTHSLHSFVSRLEVSSGSRALPSPLWAGWGVVRSLI